MTPGEIIERIRAHDGEVRLEPDGQTLALIRRHRIPDDLAAEARAHAQELRIFLRRSGILGGYTFTAHGYLCRRCKGFGRVAVIGGEITCTFCVVAEAERLAQERR